MDKSFCRCSECTLEKFSDRFVPWQFVNNPQYSVLYVGQAPGQVEALTGVPFTGDAGKMCFRLFMEAGLDKRNSIITNLVSCAPPGDREPTALEVQCCFGRLREEIHFMQPQLIVALGAVSLKWLTGNDSKITKVRGNLFDLLEEFDYPCQVLACLHPSFVMRQRQWIGPAVRDLKKVKEFFITGIEVLNKPTFVLDPSYAVVEHYLTSGSEITAFDLETTGLNPRQDKILGISFCNSKKDALACYLPPESIDPRWSLIKKWMEDKNAKKCTQNGLFDLGFLDCQKGIIVRGLSFDTHLAGKMINPDLPTNLQFLRTQYTDISPYKPSDKEMKKIGYMSKEELLTLNCWDSYVTREVMLAQKELLNEREKELINDLLLPLIPCLNEMEKKGLLVDINALAYLFQEMHPLKEKLLKEFEPIGINPASPLQVKEYFKLKDSREETLKKLIRKQASNYEWFEKILEFRKHAKMMSTYLQGVYNRLEDGRIHSNFKFGTGTLRLSSEGPNLQNVPDPMRVIYVPDSPEYYLVDLDYRQLELRVLALMAGVTSLLESLNKGLDPHEELRKIIYVGEREKITKPERQRLITKATLFGTVYGRSARSIAMEFGVDTMEAEHWQTQAVFKYPEIVKYRKWCDKQLKDYGYVTTPFGNRRYIASQTQGYNTPIQSTAALVDLTSLLKLYKAGFDLRVSVHDDNVIHCKTREEVMEAKKISEEPFDLFNGYSFPIKAKWGKDWYHVEEVK